MMFFWILAKLWHLPSDMQGAKTQNIIVVHIAVKTLT
jgi:hypothetical protein